MKSALISVNKPHTDNIFAADESEKKTVEWRTKPLPKGKHYVYETKNKGGCGKVIGEMRVLGWRKFGSVDDIPDDMIHKGKVTREFIKAYAKGRPIYANVLYDAKRYDTPKELGEFKKAGFMTEEQWLYALYPNTHCHYVAWAKKFELTRPPQSWCHAERWE